MLKNEIDIVKIVYIQRLGEFLAKILLKKHQRALITSFKKYQLKDLNQGESSHKAIYRKLASLKRKTVAPPLKANPLMSNSTLDSKIAPNF